MSASAFRKVLDAIIRLFRNDAEQASQAIAASTAGMSKLERDAVLRASETAYQKLLEGSVRRARRRAWAAALLFLEDEARKQVGAPAYLPPEHAYRDKVVLDEIRKAGGPVVAPETQKRVTDSLVRHVEMSARQTIIDAVDPDLDLDDMPDSEHEDGKELTHTERLWVEAQAAAKADEDAQARAVHDNRLAQAQALIREAGLDYDLTEVGMWRPTQRPIAWARVVQPTADKPPCGFCIMCASRGPVYASLEKALTADGTDISRYHNHCRCIAVPVYDYRSWPGKEEFLRYSEMYYQAVNDTDEDGEALRKGLTGAQIRSELDRQSRGDRSEEKSLRRKQRKWESSISDEERSRLKRQRALKSDMSLLDKPDGSTELLEAHELDFLEGFEALGERVQWIPRGELDPVHGRPPTNDFVWLSNGQLVCELKNTGNKYSSIANRITDAVVSARKHETPVIKDTFIVHLEHRLSPKLRNQLRYYNVNRPEAAISRLWVFEARTQTLTEVALKAK